jgi:hypothetical protein
MNIGRSFQTVGTIYQTAWCHLPEDTLHSHCCDRLKSWYNYYFYFLYFCVGSWEFFILSYLVEAVYENSVIILLDHWEVLSVYCHLNWVQGVGHMLTCICLLFTEGLWPVPFSDDVEHTVHLWRYRTILDILHAEKSGCYLQVRQSEFSLSWMWMASETDMGIVHAVQDRSGV